MIDFLIDLRCSLLVDSGKQRPKGADEFFGGAFAVELIGGI
jgi:hypothetical protein